MRDINVNKFKRFNFILVFFIAIILSSCNTNSNLENNPFFVYNFGGLEKLSPKEQIAYLDSMGYDGISLRMAMENHVDDLPEFLSEAEKHADFKIYSAFVRYNFQDADIDKNRWREVVDLIENKDIALWLIFGRPTEGVTEEMVEQILREVVAYATQRNVPVTLYPHHNCFYYTAEQSLPVVKRINHPNLKLALHLCHEMKAGNANRLEEVVSNVHEYISFVTLSGTDSVVDRSSPRSIDRSTIKPLNKGDFDIYEFMEPLKKVAYKGPVGLLNFNIDKDYPMDDYLQESLNKWKELSNYLNDN